MTAPEEPFEINAFLQQLAELAASNAASDGPPVPVAAGTFTLYPTPAGGIHLVVQADALGGVRRMEMQPGMMRALAAFSGGSGKLAAFLGRRKRAELPPAEAAADGQ